MSDINNIIARLKHVGTHEPLEWTLGTKMQRTLFFGMKYMQCASPPAWAAPAYGGVSSDWPWHPDVLRPATEIPLVKPNTPLLHPA